MVFHPFITLNTHNNSIKIHPVSHISENQKLIGAIDVKDVDLRTFTKLKFEQQPHHGIFISDTVNYGESNEDRVRILYLPANVGKCEDKFQDLLAWIVVMLTNICIFDISCRYIRQNKRDKLQSRSYVVMNSGRGQLRKVSIEKNGNKMQIKQKVKYSQNSLIAKQLTDHEIQEHDFVYVCDVIQGLFENITLWDSYINYEELVIEIKSYLQVHQYLRTVSPTYININNRTMVSLTQLEEVEKQVLEYNQDMGQKQAKVLVKVKRQIIKAIKAKNKNLIEKCLHEIRFNHFMQIQCIEELLVKKIVTQSTLSQYNIPNIYIYAITGEIQHSLYYKELNKLQNTIEEKDMQINLYQLQLQRKEAVLAQLQCQIQKQETQLSQFNAINQERLQSLSEVDRQKQVNRKLHIQIQTLLIEQKAKAQNQNRLQSIIDRINAEKKSLFKGIQELKFENTQLIDQLQLKLREIESMSAKISECRRLENQSCKALESANWEKAKCQEYELLMKGFVENLKVFKEGQAQKINYILNRNYHYHCETHSKIEQQKYEIMEIQKKLANCQMEKQNYRIQIEHVSNTVFSSLAHQHQENPIQT